VTKQLVFFTAKCINNLLHRMFFWMVYVSVRFSDQVKCLGVLLNASLKEWWWYIETCDIAILCSKQAPRRFRSVLSFSKNTLFRAYCMLMYACHLWSKYTLTCMMRLRVSCNSACRIMHYIPRNVSVRPHKVAIVSGPLMPCLETIRITFYNRVRYPD